MTGDITKLPKDLRAALMAEIAPGERVLYAAQPDWRAERVKLLAIFLFGVFWSAISLMFFGVSLGGLLGLVPVTSDGQPASTGMLTFMLLFSTPFVAIGALFLAAPFLAIRKSKNTIHAITEARLLDVYVGRDKGAESYPLPKINFVKRRDLGRAAGSLEIGYGVEKDSDGDPRPLTIDWSGVPDVKRAEKALNILRA